MKRCIEFIGAVSPWMTMGALMAGMQPGLTVWQKRRQHGQNGREIWIYRGEGSHEFAKGEFRKK